MFTIRVLIGAALGLMTAVVGADVIVTLQPPGRDAYAKCDPEGTSVLPNGRHITPAGRTVRITSDAFGLALAPDGRCALAIHDRVLTVIDTHAPERAQRYPSLDGRHPGPFQKGAFMGAAIAPDNRLAYLSGGNDGTVISYDLEQRRALGTIALDGEYLGRKWEDSFVGDLYLTRDGGRLFVLDQTNFRFVIVDPQAREVRASIPVGRHPFGLGVSPDEQEVYVANVGIFDYPRVPGLTKENFEQMALHFPPFGTWSKEAEEGVELDGRRIPGLGSPLVPEAVSVWVIDLERGEVVARLKTGFQIGQRIEGLEVVGGASPNSIAVGRRFAYVTNATNDNVAVIDTATRAIVDHIQITVDPALDRWRGLTPFGLMLSPEEDRLYVALFGLNAVAVLDTASRRTLGLIPTGWNPTKLCRSSDGERLYVVSARGHGAGPNGGAGFKPPPQGTYVGDIQLGTFQAIPRPSEAELARYTRQVIDNTFRRVQVEDDGRNPLPPEAGRRRSPIRHIVYITKENRTYDEVFGAFPGGRGDPELARYGAGQTLRAGAQVIGGVDVMPNHQKLAREFALSDNFYCDSDASVHGHRWMMGTYPNEWVEANSATHKDERLESSAPGRRYVAGSSGAIYPEDYNEIGGLWEHLARHQVSFFNFGQGLEVAATAQEWHYRDTGIRMSVIFPLPKPLWDRTSRLYPTYNMDIPDQYRVEMFEQELRDRWLNGAEPFPQLVTLLLPNDHGAGDRPDAGYPLRASYMADNDLALGRIVETLSHTPWWPEMLIVITEDDAQDGRDSVDAHRSLLMLVGPYVKRGYLSHTHANFGAILKTIYLLLDLPPVNQFDASASLLDDFFTPEPDLRPYEAVPVDARIFDPQVALRRYDRSFDWRRRSAGPKLDDEEDFRASHEAQAGGR